MAFTMQLCPQVSPTPPAFHKNIPTTDIPQFLPDFTLRMLWGKSETADFNLKGLVNKRNWVAKRDMLNCYGSNQLSIDELFSPTDWTARPVAALTCFPVEWGRRVCVWEDVEP